MPTSCVSRQSICLVLIAALLGMGCAASPSDREPEQGFADIAAGKWHSCALRHNGDVECWGRGDSGETSPYFGEFSVVAAAGGGTCGLRPSGAPECWGWGLGPPNDGEYNSLAMYSDSWVRQTCAISSSGKVGCWRVGLQAGADVQSWSGREVSVPTGAFTAISVAESHACGLRRDGDVSCWNFLDIGSGGRFVEYLRENPLPPGPFTAVSSGDQFTCGLRPDSEISCWGLFSVLRDGEPATLDFGEYYELGDFSLPAGPLTSISARNGYICGLRPDRSVSCWGAVPEEVAAQMPSGPFTTISAGDEHVCGLRPDGQAVCWGSDEYGQASPQA